MKRPLSLRTHWLMLALCAVLTGGLGLSSNAHAAEAAEGQRPTIEGVSAHFAHISGALEVQINPQGSETTYEIWLECQSGEDEPSFSPCELFVSAQLTRGQIAAGLATRTVSVDFTGLQAGFYYRYGIVATNSVGTTEAHDNTFRTEPPDTSSGGTGEQYGSEIPGWYNNLSNEESNKTLREYEAKQQQAAKEHEEQLAREAANRAVEEAALKKREEEEVAAEAAAHAPPSCIVPSLKGDTLSAARRALKKAHCRLGKVAQPHRSHGALVVIRQTPGRGRTLHGGDAIAVTLGRAHTKRRSSA